MKTKQLIVVAFVFFSIGVSTTQTATASDDETGDPFIVIDHSRGSYEVLKKPIFSKNDKVSIHVENTNISCYSFNLDTVKQENEDGVFALAAPDNPDTVPFTIYHDARTAAYEIDIKKISDDDSCVNQNFSETFQVTTAAWKLAFSGALTYDDLTSQKYFLEPGTRSDPTGMTSSGFFVREDLDGQDEGSAGFAILAHLYHETKFNLKNSEISWAPLTFGLGAGSDSESKFYLGTSLKFGDALFLTGGFVSGKKDVLPSGSSIGSFTENANALSTLGSKTDTAYFLGISYQFGGLNLSSFTSSFAKKKPAPNLDTDSK